MVAFAAEPSASTMSRLGRSSEFENNINGVRIGQTRNLTVIQLTQSVRLS